MKTELEQDLVSKYPILFSDYRGDPKQTCLAFGMECGDGWFDIIERLCRLIQSEVDFVNRTCTENAKYRCRADQVKEKYGTLRFYCSFYYAGSLSDATMQILHRSMDRISGMIQMAESMSALICEHCGDRGKIGQEVYPRTLCDACDTLSHDALSNRDPA
jgi:hypothetical protein